MLWTKRVLQCKIFIILSALMKVHPIPHAIFETPRSGFIKILHHCSVSWNITPLYFLAQTSYTLDKNSPLEFWEIGWKLTKLLMSNLKSHVSFSLNLASLFSAMGDKSSVLFYLKLYLIFTKGAHHSAKFQTSDCSDEISPNFYFDRVLFWKGIKFQLKKCGGVMSHDTKESQCTPPPICKGVEAPTKFSKREGGLDRTSTFSRGFLGKRGWLFSRGGCNFHIKNRLKSEIFNDQKSL